MFYAGWCDNTQPSYDTFPVHYDQHGHWDYNDVGMQGAS